MRGRGGAFSNRSVTFNQDSQGSNTQEAPSAAASFNQGQPSSAFGTNDPAAASMPSSQPQAVQSAFGSSPSLAPAPLPPSTSHSSSDEASTDEEERKRRFQSVPQHNRFLEMKSERGALRDRYIAQGILPDPNKPQQLSDATKLKGTCTDMCPEFERHEREFQGEGDELEVFPGTTKLDPAISVKIYRRPAAGRELPLPEDVRPSHILRKTLDYLFNQLLPSSPSSQRLTQVQGFIWNRTRAVRQDFIVQGEAGPIVIHCHERIARWHIFNLHWRGGGVQADGKRRDESALGDRDPWSEQQELEQLAKTLTSLCEYYDDLRATTGQQTPSPHEAEFRAYHLLLNIYDPEVMRGVELLPEEIFDAPILQTSLRLRGYAQRANRGGTNRASALNTAAPMNFFSRLFQEARSPNVSYLLACVLEKQFAQVREGALKALSSNYNKAHRGPSVAFVRDALGADSDEQVLQWAQQCDIAIQNDNEATLKLHKGVEISFKEPLSAFSVSIVEAKRGSLTSQQIIDGVSSGVGPQSTAPQQSQVQRQSAAWAPQEQAQAPKTMSRKAQDAPPVSRPSNETTLPGASLKTSQAGSSDAAAKSSQMSPFAASFAPKETATSDQSRPAPIAPSQAAPSKGANVVFPAPEQQITTLRPSPFNFTAKSSDQKPAAVSSASRVTTQEPTAVDRGAQEQKRDASAHPPAHSSAPSRPPTILPSKQPEQVKYPDKAKESAARQCLRTLVNDQSVVIAETALHKEQRARRGTARSKFLEVMGKKLLSQVTQEAVSRVAHEVSAPVLANEARRIGLLRRCMKRWDAALQSKREAARQHARLEEVRQALVSRGLLEKSLVSSAAPGTLRRILAGGKRSGRDENQSLGPVMHQVSGHDLHRLQVRDEVGEDDHLRASFNHFQAERAHLWSEGSFLTSIASGILNLLERWRPVEMGSWSVGLSLPQDDNLAAATWLRHKFGFTGGKREKEIPISPDVTVQGSILANSDAITSHLGLIVFTVSPGTVDASLDAARRRAYWQEDAARLRNIVQSQLATDNRYVPSLLIIDWQADGAAGSALDNLDVTQIRRSLDKVAVVSLSQTQDPDAKFRDALQRTLTGLRLAQTERHVTLAEFFAPLQSAWRESLFCTQAVLRQLPADNVPACAPIALDALSLLIALANSALRFLIERSETLYEAGQDERLPLIPTLDVAIMREVRQRSIDETLFHAANGIIGPLLSDQDEESDGLVFAQAMLMRAQKSFNRESTTPRREQKCSVQYKLTSSPLPSLQPSPSSTSYRPCSSQGSPSWSRVGFDRSTRLRLLRAMLSKSAGGPHRASPYLRIAYGTSRAMPARVRTPLLSQRDRTRNAQQRRPSLRALRLRRRCTRLRIERSRNPNPSSLRLHRGSRNLL